MKRVTQLAVLGFLVSLVAIACGGSGGSGGDDAEELCEDYCKEFVGCAEGEEDDEDACVDACLEFVGEGDRDLDGDCEDAAIEAIECLAKLSCDEIGCEGKFEELRDACEGEVFICDNDDELPAELVCDGVDDCDDGEDEDFCP